MKIAEEEVLAPVLPPRYYDTNAPPDVVERRNYYEEIVKKLQSANQTGLILYQEIYYD